MEALSHPPWLDLPEPITELILHRLPLSDHLRFSSVCTKWLSIQQFHRLRRAPILPLPWLSFFPENSDDPKPILCFSPFELKFTQFPIPATALTPSPNQSHQRVAGSYLGFLILHSTTTLSPQRLAGTSRWVQPPAIVSYSLLNPISGLHLQLPTLTEKDITDRDHTIVAAVAPPTDPNCIFMVPTGTHVYLCGVGDPGWFKLPMPTQQSSNDVDAAVFYKGKFYCMRSDNSMVAVDLSSVQVLDMGGWDRSLASSSHKFLVECNGDLLLVCFLFVGPVQQVQVFKADFVGRVWVKVGSLGDYVLFLGKNCSFSLLADDMGGCTKSYIYYNLYYQKCKDISNGGRPHIWMAFDLGSGEVVHGPAFPDNYLHGNDPSWLPINSSWFLPSLACVSPAAANSDPLRATASEVNCISLTPLNTCN